MAKVGLRATDADIVIGDGPGVTGPALSLLMVISGRTAALDGPRRRSPALREPVGTAEDEGGARPRSGGWQQGGLPEHLRRRPSAGLTGIGVCTVLEERRDDVRLALEDRPGQG